MACFTSLPSFKTPSGLENRNSTTAKFANIATHLVGVSLEWSLKSTQKAEINGKTATLHISIIWAGLGGPPPLKGLLFVPLV